MTSEEFQSQIEHFIQRHRLSTTTFGLWAMNDSRFVFDLLNGRSCSLATVGKVRKFMADYDTKQDAKQKRKPTSCSSGACDHLAIDPGRNAE